MLWSWLPQQQRPSECCALHLGGSDGWALGARASLEGVTARLAYKLGSSHFREMMSSQEGSCSVPSRLWSQPQGG